MPNIKQATRRAKQTESRTRRNKAHKSRLRTIVKKAELALEEEADNAAELTQEAIRRLDQAAARGTVSKKAAARRKSRFMRKLNQR